ncbi:PRC protein [Sulfitobacter noctilucae]|uniref:PRC-barrel domain-containing protein n=1 Tax=Sulfitobacter noctilucae TaxID=1342302 RepID=UPI000469B1D3|nr:PRC-barrel domain-containing protein [Sulfitobacter noctilucae]KIN60160.1 PRC protein [Sulfitobacter noctilucae]
MKRFLSTTAVLLALSGTAYADAHSSGMGTVTFEQSDFYASDLIGMRVYNSETEMDDGAMIDAGGEKEWDDIGEINDIIVSQDGEVRGVILGVGGFLGMGERDVSISMDQINVVQQNGDMGDRFLVVNTTKEMLEQAPEYERDDNDDMGATDNAASTTMDSSDSTVAMDESNDAEAMEESENETTATDIETTMSDSDNATANTDTAMGDNDLMRPTMTYDGYSDADTAEVEKLTAERIEGSYVYGANDETVGEIDTLVMSEDGKVNSAVINVGGFLGLGEKPVAVDFEKIQVLRNEDGDEYRFYIDSTKEKLEALPEYEN